jgi:hypothetical protein
LNERRRIPKGEKNDDEQFTVAATWTDRREALPKTFLTKAKMI